MKANPLISVVMSAYNAEKYLAEAIDSILNQTYKNIEFIIINDGSVDATEKIILSYTDDRIVYIKNYGNKGLIYSLNKGIELSKGEFVARMDADDVSLPNRLELQVQAFQHNTNAVVVATNYFLLYKSKTNIVKANYTSYQLKTILIFSTCFAHPTVMIKKTNKRFFYDSNFIHAEDYKLWTDLAFEGEFIYLQEPLLKYRHHNSQVSVVYKQKQLQVSNIIRNLYISKLGFTLNSEEVNVVNTIGNNDFITSKNTLNNVEIFLLKLVHQNQEKKLLPVTDFNSIIQKFWYDSCGYNNLGYYSYSKFFKSPLSTFVKNNLTSKLKLFIKTILRKYKK